MNTFLWKSKYSIVFFFFESELPLRTIGVQLKVYSDFVAIFCCWYIREISGKHLIGLPLCREALASRAVVHILIVAKI